MNLDDLADALVEHFNDLDDLPIEIEAENPLEQITIDDARSDWRLFVWPFGKRRTPLDRGDMCRVDALIDVYVHGPIKGVITRKKGHELLDALQDSLRETTLLGYKWDGVEPIDGEFDAGVLRTKKHFLSMFRATFFAFD